LLPRVLVLSNVHPSIAISRGTQRQAREENGTTTWTTPPIVSGTIPPIVPGTNVYLPGRTTLQKSGGWALPRTCTSSSQAACSLPPPEPEYRSGAASLHGKPTSRGLVDGLHPSGERGSAGTDAFSQRLSFDGRNEPLGVSLVFSRGRNRYSPPKTPVKSQNVHMSTGLKKQLFQGTLADVKNHYAVTQACHKC